MTNLEKMIILLDKDSNETFSDDNDLSIRFLSCRKKFGIKLSPTEFSTQLKRELLDNNLFIQELSKDEIPSIQDKAIDLLKTS